MKSSIVYKVLCLEDWVAEVDNILLFGSDYFGVVKMNKKRRQELFLDGIETSIEMAKIAYFRLHYIVYEYSKMTDQSDKSKEFINLILLDAWSLVDITNRLRLLMREGGLKRTNHVNLLLRSTESVEDLRNFIQHVDNEVTNISESGWPIWGSLSWAFITPELNEQNQVAVKAIIPGRLAKSKGYPIVNPAGKEIQAPVDHISLSINNDTTINLSEIYKSIVDFGNRFEIALERAKEEQVENGGGEDDILKILVE